MNKQDTTPELTAVSPSLWAEARRYLPVIQRIANSDSRTRAEVAAAAAEVGCSTTQFYVLLKRYESDPRLTSLLPRRRGFQRGGSRLMPEIDKLIDEVIETVYLTRQKPKLSDLATEVRRRCHTLGLPAPGRKALRIRVRAKPRREVVARRQGRKAARDRFGPVTGSLEAPYPLSLVQIDHTLVDVIVVDSVTRLPIQRPWITVAIDVCSRCVAGFHLSLEPPSATSVALCLAHAVLPKQLWLAQRQIEQEWPVHGLMAQLHLDNAKEFRSEALRRGCEQYGIAIDYRPVRTPHYGGHIERLIGTMMSAMHLLPGTTFSDTRIKGDLNPEKHAVMTLDEVERWLAHQIAGLYHGTKHATLGIPPAVAWKRGIEGDDTTPGSGEPTTITDPRRFLIDFLPIEERLVRRDGVRLNCISYWSDVLTTWIGEPDKMTVRYDPRDLSRIFLLAPDGQYYDLPYGNLSRPPISLSEQRLALKRLREEGARHVDEAAIFRTIEAMRKIVDEARSTTKTVRRQNERRLQLVKSGRIEPLPGEARQTEVSVAADEADETVQPWERMFPVEEWS